MLQRFSDSESSGDHNWRRMWDTPSKKSHRQYARSWVHLIPSDLPFPEALVIPGHSTGPSKFIAMSSNPANSLSRINFSVGAKRWRRSKRNMPDRWSNYVNTRTACSRRMNSCEPIWRLTGVTTRKGSFILRP